ncbi:hypothetical protein OAP87_04835 [Flavobacteriaceae bacterium]|nr:hypothetical protein [Flavobacteriaceae bacterium]
MKYNFFFLIIIVLSSCSKKTQFINEFDCEVVVFQNLERIEDVKKLFSVYYPDSWKTNLYYDKNQSSIYTADTTKQLKETMLLDITHISSELVFDSNFIRKFNSNLKQQQLTEINSNKILFRDKPTFYSEAKGVKNKFRYSVLNLFIKLDEKNYIHSTVEVYGDSLRRKRICKGINLLEKTIF